MLQEAVIVLHVPVSWGSGQMPWRDVFLAYFAGEKWKWHQALVLESLNGVAGDRRQDTSLEICGCQCDVDGKLNISCCAPHSRVDSMLSGHTARFSSATHMVNIRIFFCHDSGYCVSPNHLLVTWFFCFFCTAESDSLQKAYQHTAWLTDFSQWRVGVPQDVRTECGRIGKLWELERDFPQSLRLGVTEIWM